MRNFFKPCYLSCTEINEIRSYLIDFWGKLNLSKMFELVEARDPLVEFFREQKKDPLFTQLAVVLRVAFSHLQSLSFFSLTVAH